MMGDGREQSSGCVMASSSSPRCPHPHPPHIIFLVSVCSLSPFELVKPIYTRILQTFFWEKERHSTHSCGLNHPSHHIICIWIKTHQRISITPPLLS